jgi:hypothetical protein
MAAFYISIILGSGTSTFGFIRSFKALLILIRAIYTSSSFSLCPKVLSKGFVRAYERIVASIREYSFSY